MIEDSIGESSLRVEPLKKDRLDTAEEQGAEFSELFLGIGTFAIVAGILLLINIFVMLAQERKSQLGMLRAIGLRRGDLVRVFVIEGFLYSIAAAILGAVMGIGVGWGIARLAAPIFGGSDEFALDLQFSMSPDSIVLGFCMGIIITALTIFLTSLRISRINIIRAIRDLPEPTYKSVRKRNLIIGGIVAAARPRRYSLASLGETEAWALALLGPPVAAYALLPVISLWMKRKIAVMVVAGFSLFWGVFGNTILGNQFFESGEIFAFVMQGVLLDLLGRDPAKPNGGHVRGDPSPCSGSQPAGATRPCLSGRSTFPHGLDPGNVCTRHLHDDVHCSSRKCVRRSGRRDCAANGGRIRRRCHRVGNQSAEAG